MSDWSSGYVVDVTYTHGFYRELTPSYLGFAALVQGHAGPGLGTEALTYCELGCGQGGSTNLLASANPHIEFHANDFNPAHIAGARNLARAARLSNVHFHDSSFAEFGENRQLPMFDIIGLHGVYSWISAENRQHIVRFIRERLKPGGAVYVSYNAMPGWAPLMPLRHVMTHYAASQGKGTILTRIKEAVAFTERLDTAKARYFAANAKASNHVKKIKAANVSYLAHEYFNRDLTAFYFADIARELSEAKLTWGGSVDLLDTIDAFNLTAEHQEILRGIEDVTLRQTIRDHIIDQHFRRDIFVKGPVPLSKTALQERWLRTRFALTGRGAYVPRKVRTALGEVELQATIYDPLIAALETGPKAMGQLLEEPSLAKHGPASVRQALVLLTGQGSCHPCLPESGEPERRAHAQAFNEAVASRGFDGKGIAYLASGTTGGGIAVDGARRLVWLARHRKVDNVAEFVLDALRRADQHLLKEGKPLTSREDALNALGEMVQSYDKSLAPVLTNLGIA